jgi:capsular polysaccharide biosynthesis protein
VNDPDQTVASPAVSNVELPQQIWAYDDISVSEDRLAREHPVEDRPVDEVTGMLVNLGFLRSALRRHVRFWLAAGLIGLIAGCGLYLKFPPSYQASTSLIIANDPNQDAVSAMLTNVTLAESRPVAQAVIDKLGLQQSAASLQAACTASVVTNQVLLITVNSPSTDGALVLAQTLAAEFLQFRAQLLARQQQQVQSVLNTQVTKAQQNLNGINRKISQVSAESDTPTRQSKLTALEADRAKATMSLATLQQTATDNQATAETTTATMIQGSQVLNPATADYHSRLKGALEYVASAFLAGLVIGVGIIVVRAIVSDRLRRRDDVADVLGAPVRLSVGDLSPRRWLPGPRVRAGRRRREAQRLTAYLRNAVPRGGQNPAALVIVAVDNAPAVAQPLVTLAKTYAKEGKNVILADMSPGGQASRLLGVRRSGVHSVTVSDAHLTVAVGASDDVAPVGPLHRGRRLAQLAEPNPELIAACASADYLLTLVVLDPALGGDYLATWASDVVVTVTAGQSSATRIEAVGEMIRLAGAESVSAVLIGAEKGDETLGVPAARPSDSAITSWGDGGL